MAPLGCIAVLCGEKLLVWRWGHRPCETVAEHFQGRVLKISVFPDGRAAGAGGVCGTRALIR